MLEGRRFEKHRSTGILYGSNALIHPPSSLPILCHVPFHKITHLLVGIKTTFAGFLSAWVGCHRSCYSFRSSEVACSVCLPLSILYFGNSKNRFVPILPASVSFSLLLFGSHAYAFPGLSSHCSLPIAFLLFDSAAAKLKGASIQGQFQHGFRSSKIVTGLNSSNENTTSHARFRYAAMGPRRFQQDKTSELVTLSWVIHKLNFSHTFV